MKVRLYRGPNDGKILDVDASETMIVTEVIADPASMYDWNKDATYPTVGPRTVRSHYKRTTHTHPDGSVFFEWTMPKGTKSGVRSRKKRRANGGYAHSGWYTIDTGSIPTSTPTFTINMTSP